MSIYTSAFQAQKIHELVFTSLNIYRSRLTRKKTRPLYVAPQFSKLSQKLKTAIHHAIKVCCLFFFLPDMYIGSTTAASETQLEILMLITNPWPKLCKLKTFCSSAFPSLWNWCQLVHTCFTNWPSLLALIYWLSRKTIYQASICDAGSDIVFFPFHQNLTFFSFFAPAATSKTL